jgi:hypothetical protein
VTAFDGTNDFGGTSGVTHSGLSNSVNDTFLTMLAADLALAVFLRYREPGRLATEG